jgi:hypothetical protein
MTDRSMESDAEARRSPGNALVEVACVSELMVASRLRAHSDALKQVDAEADLGSRHKPVLYARAVHATEVGGQERPHETNSRVKSRPIIERPFTPSSSPLKLIRDSLLGDTPPRKPGSRSQFDSTYSCLGEATTSDSQHRTSGAALSLIDS